MRGNMDYRLGADEIASLLPLLSFFHFFNRIITVQSSSKTLCKILKAKEKKSKSNKRVFIIYSFQIHIYFIHYTHT